MTRVSRDPLLRLHNRALGIAPVAAASSKWLAALVEVLRYRVADRRGTFKVVQGARDLGVEIVIAGTRIKEPAATWLVYALQRLSAREREKTVDIVRSQLLPAIGPGVAQQARAIGVVLPYAVVPAEGLLEQWIAAILQALPALEREAVFGAVREVQHRTPGHHVLHAEMPKILGGS